MPGKGGDDDEVIFEDPPDAKNHGSPPKGILKAPGKRKFLNFNPSL